jgi:DNA-binding NtrC family response regulator
VRVIAATNRDLLEYTNQSKFREDLYYRLSTVPIRVPALRDRKEDVLLLFRKFAADFSEKYKTQSVVLDSAAQQILINYPWRGNVRELKNAAEQISVLSTDKNITADILVHFLPQKDNSRSLALIPSSGSASAGTHADFASERDILYKLFFDLKKDMNDLKQMVFDVANHQGYTPADPALKNIVQVYNPEAEPATGSTFSNSMPILLDQSAPHEDVEETLSLADREKEFITKALKKHKSRRRDAATELGISERTLYRKIKEYGIKE